MVNKMNKWAIVENGVVVNVVLWDGVSEWHAKEHQDVIDVGASGGDSLVGIGWGYIDGKFVTELFENKDDNTVM